jgi:pyruvate dehydrogenase E2 component (dihydrolipoamide acetyltransferase)
MKIFKLPDLGEGLPDAEISEWHVKVGDEVVLDQSLVSMETAKALVEVPSPVNGRIAKLYGGKGDVIKTGAPLIEFEQSESETPINNVEKASEDKGTVAGRLETSDRVIHEPSMAAYSRPSATSSLSTAASASTGIKVTPAVRALAQRLKVDLSLVKPTGPNATITTQDVELAAQNLLSAGPLEIFKGIRRVMALTMEQSHAEVVPVTIMDDAKLYKWSKEADITVRLMQAIIVACQDEPALNAWYDSKEIGYRLMKGIHLGIAMDTAEGLFVPVIHHAEKLDAQALRKRLDELKTEVQSRTIKPENLRGATITLSNFGKFAGRYANPIIVPPMVAILGVGRLREEPVVINGEIKVSPVLPLALSVDHRAVTGGEATRFLGKVIETLEKI